MEKVRIAIEINRELAIRAGRTQYGQVARELSSDEVAQLSEGERVALSQMCCNSNGEISPSLWITSEGGRYGIAVPRIADSSLESIRTIIAAWPAARDAFVAEMAAEKAAAQAGIVEMLARRILDRDEDDFFSIQDNEKVVFYDGLGTVSNDIRDAVLAHQGAASKIIRMRALLPQKRTEHEEKLAAKKVAEEAKKAAEMAKRVAEREQIDAEVATMSETAQRRHARGLLDVEEVKQHMAEKVFAPLDGYQRYEDITDEEVIESYTEKGFIDEYYEGEVKYITGPMDSVTEGTFQIMEGIEKLTPGATVAPKGRVGYLADTTVDEDRLARVERVFLHVSVPYGVFTFSREYAG